MNSEPLTTGQVLRKLAASGLRVTRNMLAQDVRDGYLSPPVMEPRGNRRGIGRLWSFSAYRRAVYLYRLRKRGVRGELLRVLLFLRDGWGWERVKPICLKGFSKLVKLNQSEVKKSYRKPQEGDVEGLVPEIAKEWRSKEETVRCVLGMGFFGKPLEGGSLTPFYQAIEDTLGGYGFPWTGDIPMEPRSSISPALSMFAEHSGWSWPNMQDAIEAADDGMADFARIKFIAYLHSLRHALNHYNREHNEPKQTTNLITLGQSYKEIAEVLWNASWARLTPAQLLAAHMASMIPVAIMIEVMRTSAIDQMPQLLAPYAQNEDAVSKFQQFVEWLIGGSNSPLPQVNQQDYLNVRMAAKKLLKSSPEIVKDIEANPQLKQLVIEALELNQPKKDR